MTIFVFITGCGSSQPPSSNLAVYNDATCTVIDVCTNPIGSLTVTCRAITYIKGIGEGVNVPDSIYNGKSCLITKEDYTVIQGPGPAAPKY